jgi:lauroyl/myristoyl acyltransferase
MKWLNDNDSVTKLELIDNMHEAINAGNTAYFFVVHSAAYSAAYAAYVASYAAAYAAYANSALNDYFAITGENKQDYTDAIGEM